MQLDAGKESSLGRAALQRSSNIVKKMSHDMSKMSTNESMPSLRGSVFQIKQKSHEELDIEIQSHRILHVLDELIYKLEIVAAVPILIQDGGRLLYKCFPPKDAEFIMEVCQQYTVVEDESEDTMFDTTSAISGSRAFSMQQKESNRSDMQKDRPVSIKEKRPDASVHQVIALICNSETLKNQVLEMDEADMDELTITLIEGARRLRAVAVHKLQIPANEERERERELRKAWKENAEAKILIANIQEKLNKQKEELDVQLNAKEEQIKAYTEKIEVLKAKFKEDIKKRVNDSEKYMIQKTQHSEDIQAQLQQEAKDTTHNYWTLLDQHLAAEKQLRTRKIKIEAQLANWLAKFDQDIGEKQTEYEDLQKLYDEEMQELQTLQRKFDEQEEEYLELMAERDDYERRIYEKKAYTFLMNRSARKIQRFWRAYRERKRARKKARKAKKEAREKGSASESGADSAKPAKTGKGKGKGKKKGKEKKTEILVRSEDPMAKLESKFKGHILEDINTEPIPEQVTVDL